MRGANVVRKWADFRQMSRKAVKKRRKKVTKLRKYLPRLLQTTWTPDVEILTEMNGHETVQHRQPSRITWQKESRSPGTQTYRSSIQQKIVGLFQPADGLKRETSSVLYITFPDLTISLTFTWPFPDRSPFPDPLSNSTNRWQLFHIFQVTVGLPR